jgi:hypothetical protein
VSAFLLASCGGGGAETHIVDVGPVAVNPPAATWYAGVKNTLSISGGSPPFTLSSSEPGIFPVPLTLNGRTLDVVPGQPGVVDAGLQANELQVRSVNITARSAEGLTATAIIKVAQNFLTGYGMFVLDTTCSAGTVCAGGESALFFDSTFNGALFAGHQFRIERVRGPFQFVDPLNTNNQVDAVTVTADHEGKFTTVIRVAANIPTQVALIKITDIPTGAYTFRTIPIGTAAATGALVTVPDQITLTGPNGTTCGFGQVDVLVFDGQAPYTATCPNPQIQVLNPVSGSQPGRFTFTVGASQQCLTAEQCVITDNTGARIIIPITTVTGTSTPPTPLTAVPTSITLNCGQTGAVTVVGGSGSYSVNSTHQRIQATVSGNTVSITRLGGDAGQVFPLTGVVSVTDGSTATPITVNIPVATCP